MYREKINEDVEVGCKLVYLQVPVVGEDEMIRE